jgi:hypothetical protein
MVSAADPLRQDTGTFSKKESYVGAVSIISYETKISWLAVCLTSKSTIVLVNDCYNLSNQNKYVDTIFNMCK